ncbi:helix-turn-helix domain-containing protein [Brevibacterium otitidis]|uniref:Helix-turn-helix domain-containing protein n=1 Tax=Brevibacterium otitidis TaxID=53364 RepID=A0ABV5X4E4_9MICO|nr:hypothetical protein GCM10023233_27300 [Brevibacterium otitidis]
MTPEQFRVIREGLGLSQHEMSQRLAVQQRTVQRWEAGDTPVPAGIIAELEQLCQLAADEVAENIEIVGGDDPALTPMLAIEPGEPAGWQRAIAWRTLLQVPGLRIERLPDDD